MMADSMELPQQTVLGFSTQIGGFTDIEYLRSDYQGSIGLSIDLKNDLHEQTDSRQPQAEQEFATDYLNSSRNNEAATFLMEVQVTKSQDSDSSVNEVNSPRNMTNTSQAAFAKKIIEYLQQQPDNTASDNELFAAVCSLLSEDCLASKNASTPRRCFRSALKPMLAAGTILKVQKGKGRKGTFYEWACRNKRLEDLEKQLILLTKERDEWKSKYLKLSQVTPLKC